MALQITRIWNPNGKTYEQQEWISVELASSATEGASYVHGEIGRGLRIITFKG